MDIASGSDVGFVFEEMGCQSTGGQPNSLVIPSGINEDPNYKKLKYVSYREHANPL